MAPHNFGENFLDEEVSTGTTIVAVKYQDGVVIGADSRTSTGIYVANRVTDKLTRITDNVYCCRSGSAADTQAVADAVAFHMYLLENQSGAPPAVKKVAYKFRDYCYNNRDQLLAGILVAGYDYAEVSGKIYTISVGGMLHEDEDYSLGGSGSSYIHGLMHTSIKKGDAKNRDKDKTLDLVKLALSQAMLHDGSSGGVIRLCTITKEGVERFLYTFSPDKNEYVLTQRYKL